jgi:hypothetical protein
MMEERRSHEAKNPIQVDKEHPFHTAVLTL